MKKKVLFYGNCQAGVLGEWLNSNYSEAFDVIDCKEGGLEGFSGTKVFAVWSPENTSKQQELCKRIQDKISECDIFVFSHVHERAIDELKTQNICTGIAANKLKICIPNVRLHAYPVCTLTLMPFIKHVYHTMTKDPDLILNYLLNEIDPKFEEIINQQYNVGVADNISRHQHNLNIYENVLDMNEIIEENWKKHLLFGTHSHPIGMYWTELIKKFCEKINIPFDNEKAKNITYPNKNGIVNVQSFRFFQQLFPDILVPTEIEKLNEVIPKNIFVQPLETNYAN